MRLRTGFALGLLVIAIGMQPNPVSAKEPTVEGGRLTFELVDLNGIRVTSFDERFRNRVVFVTLWGTWCPPCVSEIPTFNDLQRRYSEDGLVVVAIAFEKVDDLEGRRLRLEKFKRQHAIEYLILDGGSTTDFSPALPTVRNVKGLPVEITIDRSGAVADCRNGYGYSKRWARKLEDRLVKLLEAAPGPDVAP